MQTYYTNVEKRGENIMLRCIDAEGNKHQFRIPFSPEFYVKSNAESDMQSVEGFTLAKKTFNTMSEGKTFLDRYRGIDGFSIYGQKDFIFQFIAENYRDMMPHDINAIDYGFIDIEVFSGSIGPDGEVIRGPFPEPEDANYPVSAITIWDSRNEVFRSFGLEVFNGKYVGTYVHDKNHPKVGHLNVVYSGHKTESDLLVEFLTYWKSKDFDIMSGWNSEFFDCYYLYNRLAKILGPKAARSMSPWDYVSNRTITNEYGEQKFIQLGGMSWVDYRDLVQKHGFIEPDNWKVGTVGKVLVGEEKLSYAEEKSLNDLYVKNFQKYINYNLQDVNLVVKMNKKKKFIETTVALAYLLKCNYKDTLKTVRPWSSGAYVALSGKGIQPEIKSGGKHPEIIGGYVKEPIPGKYKWITSVDANSLYPHMMMQFNMGPETILSEYDANIVRGELVEEINQMIDRLSIQHDRAKITWLTKVRNSVACIGLMHEFYWDADEFIDFETLKRHNVCMAPNCAIFRLDRRGIWAEICEGIYDARAAEKVLMLETEQKLVDFKNANSDRLNETDIKKIIFEMETKISVLKVAEQAKKLMLNSLYGAISNDFFSEYIDTRIAEAITSAGQTGIQMIGHRMNKYFNAVAGTANYDYAHYNDTDSAYINLNPLIQKLFKGTENDNPIKVIDFMDRLFKERVTPKMLEWADELARSYNCPKNKLIFKREKLIQSGIWTAKKRYAILYWDNEGVRYDKPRIGVTGLESVRSSTPAQCREWLGELYGVCLTNDKPDMLHARVKEIEAEFMQQPPENIGKTISINDMEKYATPDGWYGKGTTKQAKASFIHNRLVDRFNLATPKIVSGDKIMMLDLIPSNPYGYAVVGFVDHLPEEFGLHGYVNRHASFEKSFIDPLGAFVSAIGWTPKKLASLDDFWS